MLIENRIFSPLKFTGMNKIVVLFEFAGMGAKEYDVICEDLRKNNKLYNYNRPSHVAFERDGKWCVVDVWNSEEAMREFAETGLMPAFQKLGINPPQPVILPAYSYKGVVEEFMSA